ncbi:MAG TPA: DUF2085 domain-containing protein [Thermomicrobiales bacterium]
MAGIPHRIDATGDASPRRLWMLPFFAGSLVLLFLAAPWPLEQKAHVVLHGLCAQRPSHSFQLGGQTLPFDARMTGIYGGFLGSAIYLALRHRLRAAALPSWPTMGVLAAFIGLMALDGTNSLLLDLRAWHPYEPDNRLRLLTGLMTGVALAAALAFLVGSTLWRRPRLDRRVVTSPVEPLLMLALQAPFALMVVSGRGWLYVPVTLLLVIGAAAALASLMLAVILLVRGADNSFDTLTQADGYAAAALFAGVGVMVVFSCGRFLLERLTGAPPLT